MEPELKSKWVAALRSGEYRQGKDALHKDGAYCCIGVLCKVAGADMSGQEHDIINRDEDGEWASRANPTAWFDEGLFTEDEELGSLGAHFGIGSKVEGMLIDMNDSKGRSFHEIADWIVAHDLETGQPLT